MFPFATRSWNDIFFWASLRSTFSRNHVIKRRSFIHIFSHWTRVFTNTHVTTNALVEFGEVSFKLLWLLLADQSTISKWLPVSWEKLVHPFIVFNVRLWGRIILLAFCQQVFCLEDVMMTYLYNKNWKIKHALTLLWRLKKKLSNVIKRQIQAHTSYLNHIMIIIFLVPVSFFKETCYIWLWLSFSSKYFTKIAT